MTVYGWWKDGFKGAEQARKDFKKFGEAIEKYDCKLLFWAGSYGVPEPAMYAIKIGDIKKWEKSGRDIFPLVPLDRTRTIFGWDYSE
jgi:hypothetical protein